MSSGPVPDRVRATPDPGFEPTVHGTWGDLCYERDADFYADDRVVHKPAATPRDPNPATTPEPRTRTAQPEHPLRPAVSPTTTVIQGCGGVLAPEASGATRRIRLLAQIESLIRATQLAHRRSLLNASPADLRLRSRNEAVAARRRGLFTESARLAQIRRNALASSTPLARGTASELAGNKTPESCPETSPHNGQRPVAGAASPTRTRTRTRTRGHTRMITSVVPVATAESATGTTTRS